MDERGQMYFAPENEIPQADKDRLREAYEELERVRETKRLVEEALKLQDPEGKDRLL